MKQQFLGFGGLLMVSALAVLPGCESEIPVGCTDRRAVNYDPEAFEDNGECIYPADLFVGRLTGSDTAQLIDNQGNPYCEASKITFEIRKEEWDKVVISGFADCPELIEAKVLYEKYLYTISGYEHHFMVPFTMELRDGLLYFEFWTLPNVIYPDPVQHTGVAVWR